MTPTAISTNELLGLLWRVVMLDATAFQELRDTAHLTLIAAGGLVAAVVIAGFGAWLYSHTVLEGGDFSFVKTVLSGQPIHADSVRRRLWDHLRQHDHPPSVDISPR